MGSVSIEGCSHANEQDELVTAILTLTLDFVKIILCRASTTCRLSRYSYRSVIENCTADRKISNIFTQFLIDYFNGIG